MFFKFLSFKQKLYTSPASRFTTFYENSWLLQNKDKRLSLYPKWKAGRNDSGKIVFRTRSSLKIKLKQAQLNYSLRTKFLGFISAFHFLPYKNKLLSLIFFSHGGATYFLTSEKQKIFSFFIYTSKYFKKLFKFKRYYFMLFQIKKLSFVSFIEITPGKGAQYCRSPGTSARIFKFDDKLHTALLKLPSGVKKFFSYFSFSFLGKIALRSHKRFLNNKAGYWRSFGSKPIVRGVAMNPVDHPHGGRTKSIKYPRTPWGKTTKFK